MADDPFSDVLRLIDAKSLVSGSLIADGDWAIRFPASDRVNFWGIVHGSCWCAMEGADRPLLLEPGDFLLRASPRTAVLATDLQAKPIDLADIPVSATGNLRRLGDGDGEGEGFSMVGGKVDLDETLGAALLASLPTTVLIKHGSPHAAVLQDLLAQLVRERTEARLGVAAASAHIAHLMFIQILRAHLESDAAIAPGWLRLLGNQRLAPAVQLLHAAPERSWGLHELASACSMSRASFAAHFKASAGLAPLAYLAQLRIRLAARALVESDARISTVAFSLGYASESAFSAAFKRIVGEAPARYRRARRPEKNVPEPPPS
ncbi:AraC family transcriptional regulator [Roseateles sp. L2-2]|uniref:AraC family transcriptional regulator n=1 Tax=Roseateles sp. L2-2 TaxID=3422597 RepID=UPI003D36170A